MPGRSAADAPTPSAATAVSSACRDIHAYYGESYIVQGVSFDVAEGDIVALLGRNGAGKTSTLRTIARARDPELKRGEIWLGGKPIHRFAIFAGGARRASSSCRRTGASSPGLTVEENLDLAQIAEPQGWSLERIYDHFPRLAERRKQEGVTLSGGEQQMLAVARALARDMKLLLLDEPYEGLAPVIVQEIERIVSRDQGSSASRRSSSSRMPSPRCELADRALILDMGHIVFDGPAKAVLDNVELRNEYLAI